MGLAAVTENKTAHTRSSRFLTAVERLQKLTHDELVAVNGEILARLQSPVEMIPELAGHLINSGGKRIRPMLTIAAARIFDYPGAHHVKLAAAVELIHGATLLHDDVVDASALRRGSETANIIWGNKESVLVGDFVFSRAFELMVAAQNLPVLRVLSHASGVIAQGEVLQLATQKNIGTNFEMYLNVVESKTAALFAAAAEAGALIANCSDDAQTAMRSYGKNFGVAYQLVDDALDYAGFEASLGKSVGDDFREGKMTLPVVYAISRAGPEEKAFWRRVIQDGEQRPGDFERARELMERSNALADTLECAKRYAQFALRDLARAPANHYRDALGELAEASLSRAG